MMPVATSSRRKPTVRRHNVEDIEEDKATQNRNEDVDDSDDGAPHPVKRGKQSNGKQKAAPQDSDGGEVNEGEGDDDDEDERIDVSNFKNQPLGTEDARHLTGLADDWGHIEKVTRNNWKMVRDIATAIADVSEDGSGEKDIDALDTIMKELVDISAEMNSHIEVINEIQQKVAIEEEVNDVVDRYFIGLKAKNKAYAKKTTRQKYAKSEGYIDFKTGVWEVMQPDTPMPPLSNFIDKEDGDVSDDDDDLEIGGRTQDYKCPLSMTPLVNPVTSSVCGHSYSADAIKELFKGKTTLRCPASGCKKTISLSDCKADKELGKKVKAWQRRKARQDDHSDDAEEIID